jgi:hypothetical protein
MHYAQRMFKKLTLSAAGGGDACMIQFCLLSPILFSSLHSCPIPFPALFLLLF